MHTVRGTIHDLQHAPEFIPLVAQWCVETWGGASGLSHADYVAWIQQRLQPERYGTFWILRRHGDKVPIGCVQLTDLLLEPQNVTVPALANLYVIPEMRGQGCGRLLCQYVAEEAQKRGLEVLYLVADPGLNTFYATMAWQEIAFTQADMTQRIVMRRKLV